MSRIPPRRSASGTYEHLVRPYYYYYIIYYIYYLLSYIYARAETEMKKTEKLVGKKTWKPFFEKKVFPQTPSQKTL